MTAIDKLIAAVEVGTLGQNYCISIEEGDLIDAALPPIDGESMWRQVIMTMDGDLSAAYDIHHGQLPGWGFAVESDGACVWHPDTFGASRDICTASGPARAWLLAILKAVKAEGGAQ